MSTAFLIESIVALVLCVNAVRPLSGGGPLGFFSMMGSWVCMDCGNEATFQVVYYDTCQLTQQDGRFLSGEAQVGGAQLGQLAAGPQPRQRQRRVSPAGHHHPQARRQVLQQERHRLVHRPGIDQVVVIQDQQHLIRAGAGGQLVDQDRHQPLR